jgi:hypothetical protein
VTGPEFNTKPSQQTDVWLDGAAVDPGWAPPADDMQRPRRRRLLTVGIPVLILVVLVAGVWAFGGFRERKDTATTVAAGTTFVNGPLQFSFSTATVQKANGYGKYKRIQKVVVSGTVRNTGNEALSPSGDWFFARALHGGEVQTGDSAGIGDPDQFSAPDHVTPGLPAVPIHVNFEFPPTYQPGHTILFAVGTLSYGTHSYFSSGDSKYWDVGGGSVFRITLPLTKLAAEPSY